ncbi:unnamed protein product [Aphanomyces euteiches]|nr:hypothetical protein AeRB84_006420 [Aphanomyces euteiches]
MLKLLPRSPWAAHYEVCLYMALWYVVSPLALWANKFLVYSLSIDTSILSLAQLGMSVVCGFVVEIRALGFRQCLTELKASFTWASSKDAPQSRLKDMLTLGFVRTLNLLFDLAALKYISVSLAQTIKSSAPFFTVILTYAVLGKSTSIGVTATLLPIVMGLACCSVSAFGGIASSIGLLAALSANCTDCLQNVLSKKFLSSSLYSVTQLQLNSSIIAVAFQGSFLLYQAMSGPVVHLSLRPSDGSSHHHILGLILLNSIAYYVQSALAYKVMSKLSAVSHSVASTFKRALLIIISIFRYGEQVTVANWMGIALVLTGVYLFHHVSKQEVKDAKETLEATEELDALIEIAEGFTIDH